MYVELKSVNPHLRTALDSVGYGCKDVQVEAAETVDPTVGGGSGARGFVTIVNLDTGARQTVNGSWGGANMFAHSPVDGTEERITIPPNGAVIKGTRGYPRTFATVYAHPTAVGAHLLPSGAPADDLLTDVEKSALGAFVCLKSGEYRREALARCGATAEVLGSLVLRGYLKRNRAGATQITTKGKNAPYTRVH